MRHFLSAAMALIPLLFSCSKPAVLQSGDLLFVGSQGTAGTMDEAISAATGNFVHVAVLDIADDGSVLVIDATPEHGVDRHPLDTLIADFKAEDGSLPHMEVRRLRDTSGIGAALRRAVSLCGKDYDYTFLPDNDAYYCSELVWECFLGPDGSHVFDTVPMNFRAPDGSMPQYWTDLFSSMGMAVPEGVSGTNPQQISQSQDLYIINLNILPQQ